MADRNQTQVDLLINGQQSVQELEKLRKRANELKKSLEDAYRAGNNQAAQAFKKELNKTNADLRKMESGVNAVERCFKQLNKATPADLNRSLKFLQNELKNVERGSDAWKSHTEKIRILKAELAKVNSELQQSESVFTRMKNTVNNWGASIAAGAAAMTGIVAAGKAAVNAYAEMEQEEANVRKYTGMTAEQVAHLNEEFRKMDTRTSREALNQLAQEAGRLGKQSEEDVLGFVRAADKINVALDDLGDGATLTLSKLTSIFGDEQRLGTERSLLAVGSVINELSQNCTASAPYLADFAQRLAGVGAQANMSIPEIMGFAAVLDSQGQKVEMSATALSKVIMNLFKQPEKIAKATGLAVEEFSETCKRSTNEGLMMLLNRLNELGGIDSLAPVFADMGENGARASAVLAALAGNIDQVRAQQEAANVAFEEATSIDKEFEVQNTTVMADLEKRKKIFQEHAIELGQKLLPVMGYFHSSMSMTMKALSMTIDWIIKWKGEIIAAGAAVATYYAIVKAKDAWDAFVDGTKSAIAGLKKLYATMMANPYAFVMAAIVGIGTAIALAVKKHNEMTEAQKALEDTSKKISDQYTKEKAKIDMLNDAVHDETLSLNARREALRKLQDLVPDYHASLTEEGKLMNDNVEAVDNYVKALERGIQLRVYQEKLEELYRRKMQAEQNIEDRTADLEKAQQEASAHAGDVQMRTSMGGAGPTGGYESSYSVAVRVNTENLEGAKKELGDISEAIEAIKQKMGKSDLLSIDNPSSGDSTGGTVSPLTPGTPDEKELKKQHEAALKAVEDWKKKEAALNQIAYLQGEKDHCDYNDRAHEIDVEYWEKRMAVEKEGSTEYLEARAKMLEAKKKQDDFYSKGTIEEEQERYSDEKAVLQQHYADGQLSARAYQLAAEQAELEHLQNMVNLYKEGSEERIKAQEVYQNKSLQYQRKHAEEAQKMQERLRADYFKSVSGNSNPEGMAEEKAQLEIVKAQLLAAATTAEQKLEIEEAYQRARYEIAKKYSDEAEMMAVDSARATTDQILEYLNSEGYQAANQAFSTMVNGMAEIFSGLTSLIDAEVDLQTAKIEKKYEAEIKAAGKNSKQVAKLEEQKEKEIAAVKNEAEEKKYGMQIMSAIAQTAVSAINAYSSAAAIPVVGWVMGPIAAAMAVAAGAIQIATLKQQHEAAMSQGYATGGYTMPGKKYQPAGIVHAGEWVASQELLANPTAAATIAQLDEAQRTNTIGQLDRQQVSASVSAPVAIAASSGQQGNRHRDDALSDTIMKLNERLNKPFVNINTVTGDQGTLQAQKEYEQLMRNKSKR